MRCCINTIEYYCNEHSSEEVVDGLVIDCMHEHKDNRQIRIIGDTWEWNGWENEEA